MRVAVTGATGMLGLAIMHTLIEQGHDVVPIGRTPIGDHFVTVDLFDSSDVARAIVDMDWVVHAAGKIGSQQHGDTNERMAEAVGIAATEHQKLINLSSVAVYGDVPSRIVDEATRCNPVGDYGRSKLRSEQALDRHVSRAIHLRIGDVYDEARLASIAASKRQRLVRANEVCNLVFVQDVADVAAYLVERSLDPLPSTLNVVRPGLGEVPYHRIIGPFGTRGMIHRRMPHQLPHLIRSMRGVPSLPNKIFTSSAMSDVGFEYRPLSEVAPASWLKLTAGSQLNHG